MARVTRVPLGYAGPLYDTDPNPPQRDAPLGETIEDGERAVERAPRVRPIALPIDRTRGGQQQALTPASVGLGNVDNTSDIAKPVSALTAAAIASAISMAMDGVSDLVELGVADYFVLHPQTFEYDQPAAVLHWVIVHPLDHRPEVHVTDSSGAEWMGEVNWPADNTVTVDFNTPLSGHATLT